MRGEFFFSFSIAFFVGVFALSFWDADHAMLMEMLVAASLAFAIACVAVAIHRKDRFAERSWALILLGSLLAFCLGALRMEYSKLGDHPLDEKLNQKIELRGTVCDEPTPRAKSQGVCFKPDGFADKILLSASKTPKRAYGDRLDVTGKLQLPQNFTAYDGGPEFDYVSYLWKDDIRYLISYPKVSVIGPNQGNALVVWLIAVRTAFMDHVRLMIPEPQASLMGGLLVGEKGTLPDQVNEDFKRCGLTHILVLSGSNITIVAESLLMISAFLPKIAGSALGAGAVVLFSLMTGWSSTAVRATIMAVIGLFVRALGRRYDVSRSLVASAVIMVIQNPRLLAFDISSQLSFLATIAVIYVSPLVKERIGFVPETFGARDVVAMTVATQLFTLPFIFEKMGEVSVIALIPNLLVLPTVPYAMLGGFVVGVTAFFGTFLAAPLAVVTNWMLLYMLKVTAIFSALPFATIKATFGPPLLFITYAIYTAVIIFLKRRQSSPPQSSS